jgi:tetratricopeptide (TPR) repeat protein
VYGYIGYGLNRGQINQIFDFIFGNDLSRGVKKQLDKGIRHAERNELRKAIEEFDKGIKDDHKNSSYEIRTIKAEILNQLKESHDEAINLCNEALRIVEKVPIFEYLRSRAMVWIHKADGHEGKKEYDLALKCVSIALNIMPDSPITWFAKGYYLMEVKEYKEALKNFETAIFLRELFEGKPFAIDLEFKGKALMELERLEEAYSCFQEVLKRDPENKTALEKIALIEKEL